MDHDVQLNAQQLPPSPAGRWWFWQGLLLAAYALFGKGAAYLGVPPLYVGEMLLAAGLFALILTPGWSGILRRPQILLLIPFMIWGAFQTFPYLRYDGIDALRDGAVWGYGIFAIVGGGLLIAHPERLAVLFKRYRIFVVFFLLAMPLLVTVQENLPAIRLPGQDVSFLAARRGNTMVHAAAAAGFIIAGLATRRALRIAQFSLPVLFLFAANRAGMLAFMVAMAAVGVLTRWNRRVIVLGSSMVVIVLLLGVAALAVTTRATRDDALGRLQESLTSMFSDSGTSSLDNTKEWRLKWWGDIVDYTVNGRFFWTGKGYGVNLATDDGYQVEDHEALRAPHSIHMTFLARSGVPGFVLWIALQVSWAAAVLRRYHQCRRDGDERWRVVFLVIGLYWLSAMVNASFDVDFEGPMGGIWFWTVFGIGVAALEIHERCPEVLDAPIEEQNYEPMLAPSRLRHSVARTLTSARRVGPGQTLRGPSQSDFKSTR